MKHYNQTSAITYLLTVAAGVSVLAGSMYRILLDSACASLTISIVSSDFFWSARYTFLLLEHITTDITIPIIQTIYLQQSMHTNRSQVQVLNWPKILLYYQCKFTTEYSQWHSYGLRCPGSKPQPSIGICHRFATRAWSIRSMPINPTLQWQFSKPV